MPEVNKHLTALAGLRVRRHVNAVRRLRDVGHIVLGAQRYQVGALVGQHTLSASQPDQLILGHAKHCHRVTALRVHIDHHAGDVGVDKFLHPRKLAAD